MSPVIRASTRIHRGQMPHGGIAFSGRASISKNLAHRLNSMDSCFELHHLGDHRVHAYRVKSYGVTPSGDFLTHQFVLKYPPGEWLIECLQECDAWKKYGDPRKAAKGLLESCEDAGEVHERNTRLRVSEITESLAPELISRIVRGRRVVHLGTP